MKIINSLIIFLLCSFCAWGQTNITVSGVVLDQSDNEPIVAGSIELLRTKDSVLVTGAITDVNGLFSMKVTSEGNYVLKATYLGYLALTQTVRIRSGQTSVDVGKLYMKTNDILLKEAVIEGKKPEVIVKNDTIEYDAASYKVSENAVVEDLLKKLPGVDVDKEGKITVNGKEVKKFLVDSKEFFSDDPQIASKNLPAEIVDKLQVIDQKSDMARMTGFDDGDEQTIINLTIRPGMKKGTMGNVLLGAGADLQNNHDVRYQAGAFVNQMKNNNRYTLIAGTNNNNNMGAADLGANQFGGMRMRRGGGGGGITRSTNVMLSVNKEFAPTLSLNSDIRYNGSNRFSINKVNQMTLSKDQSQLDFTRTNTRYYSDNVSANFTFEWKPDPANILIFRPNIRYNQSHSDEEEWLKRSNNDDPAFDSDSKTRDKGRGWNLGGSLDYSHKFDKPGRVFSINAQGTYGKDYSWENALTLNTKYEESSLQDRLDQRSENDNRTDNYRLTFSYVEPLGRNNFLQFVYRITHLTTKSVNSTYDLWDDILDYDPTWAASLIQDSVASLIPDQSRSTLRHSTEQRFGLNFKAVRAKYNYTVGINIDPTHSLNETYQPANDTIIVLPYRYDRRLTNEMGNLLISSIGKNVVNFSPVINFNYLFSQRNNLRIDYEGETNQPSANQLRDFVDMSRPTDWTQGNPNLKPGYQNSLRARYNRYIPTSQLMFSIDLSGAWSYNDITSVTLMQEGGIRMTTYENINGNWNMQLRGTFNTPLRNKRFSVSNFISTNYRNQNSYIADSKSGNAGEKIQNTMKNLMLMDNASINYRSEYLDIGLNTFINYNRVALLVNPENNQNTFSLGIGANITWRLPYKWEINSDFTQTSRTGYAAGFNGPEIIWNIGVTKQLFSKKIGTGYIKLQCFDLLQDRNNVTSTYTTNGYRTSEVNAIPSYFMCSFIYKFSAFPKSSSATEDDFRPRGGSGRGDRPRGSGGNRSF
ncbi:MAG: outer membrane beta-barrel protein [Candidatus Azobacteroides sp.]|nr:outer membrane beta-barrel protein [Candidatus Azobacteroides sp.]